MVVFEVTGTLVVVVSGEVGKVVVLVVVVVVADVVAAGVVVLHDANSKATPITQLSPTHRMFFLICTLLFPSILTF